MKSMKFTLRPLKRLVLIGAALIGFQATAQDMSGYTAPGPAACNTGGTFNWGFKMGPTFGYFSDNLVRIDNGDPNGQTKKGLSIGGHFTYHINEWLSARGEVWFLQSGHPNIVDPGAADLPQVMQRKRNITLNMVDVPLLLAIYPPGVLPKYCPNVYFGPSFGFIVNARQEAERVYNIDGIQVTTLSRDRVTSKFTTQDIALNFGAGFKWPAAKSYNVIFDARYRMGLTNVNNDMATTRFLGNNLLPSGSLPAADLTTNTLMFTVGLEF